MYICMYMYICVYIYIYIYTHTNMAYVCVKQKFITKNKTMYNSLLRVPCEARPWPSRPGARRLSCACHDTSV